MRLFVAVLPPDQVLRELAREVGPLRELPGSERLRWTAVDGWHLTLAFLGEVAEERLPALCQGFARVAGEHRPLGLRLAEGGRFGDRTLWVGVAGDTRELRSLAEGVGAAAVEAGCEGSEFDYHPHLTLARAGRHPQGSRGGLRAAAGALAQYRGSEWRADGIRLMRSEFTGGPAHYTTLHQWALGTSAPGE